MKSLSKVKGINLIFTLISCLSTSADDLPSYLRVYTYNGGCAVFGDAVEWIGDGHGYSDYSYKSSDDRYAYINVSWQYDGDPTFTFPSHYNSIPVRICGTYESGDFPLIKNITKVIIPNGVLEVTSLPGSAKELELSPSVQKFSSVYASGLKSIKFSTGCKTFSVSGCWGLESIEIPSSVIELGQGALSGCGIRDLNVPETVQYVGMGLCSGCSSLTNVVFNAPTYIHSSSFSDCTSLKNIVLGDQVKGICTTHWMPPAWAWGTVLSPFDNCTALETATFGAKISGVLRIDLFQGCKNLRDLKCRGNVTGIGNNGFSGCYSLTNLESAAVITSVGDNGLNNCQRLSNRVFDTSKCKTFGANACSRCYAFNDTLDLTSATSVGNSAFSECTNIKELDYRNKMTTIPQYAFSSCTSLTNVLLAANLKSIGNYAFYRCSKLNNVIVPEKVTYIGTNAFYGCSSASNFVFQGAPPSVGNNAFNNVKSGATGFYSAAHAAEWEAVIDSKGYWNGLKMKPSHYTVIYDANNGTGARTTATVEWGEPTPAGDGTFTWEAHYFMGWAFEDVGGSTLGSDDVIPEPQEGNTVTLYGQWATFEPVAADWGTGSITLKATGVSLKEGEDFFLSYCDAASADSDGAQWEYVEDVGKTIEGNSVSLTDSQYSSRLGGIPAVRYRLQIGKSKDDVRARLYCTTRNRFGIVVGLGKYDKAKYGPRAPTELAQCRNDAKLFEEVMRNEGGIESANMFALYDSEGTVENVSKKWETVATQAVPGDTVFFCMGTHGGLSTPQTSGGGGLAAYDGIYSSSFLKGDLEPFLSGGRCDGVKVVLILPNCHSEAMVLWPSVSSESRKGIVYVTAAANDEVGITFETNNPSAYTEFGLFFMRLGLLQHQADEQTTLKGVDGVFGNQNGAVDLLECAKYTAALDLGMSDKSPAHVRYDDGMANVMSNTILVNGNRQDRIDPPGGMTFYSYAIEKIGKGIKISFGKYNRAEYALVRYCPRNENIASAPYRCFLGEVILKTEEFATVDDRDSYLPLTNDTEYCFQAITVGAGGFSDTSMDYKTTRKESDKRIIVFNANGGTVSETEREVLRGSAIGNLPTPTNGDYRWLGWFKRDGNGNWCEVDANTIVFDSEVYYARWKELELYHTVGFDANGAPVSFAPIVVRAWEPVGDLPEPQWEGHTFVGWFSKYGGHGTQLKAYSMVGRDQIYYAYWTTMPVTYLNSHNAIATASNGDIATAAAMTAANGCRTVGECYALGINPEDPNDDLKITDFKMEGGKPVITLNHTKDGSGNSFESRIKTLGKKSLMDADWVDITDIDQSGYRFFKVAVPIYDDDGGSGDDGEGNSGYINLDDFVIEQGVLRRYGGEAVNVVIPSCVTNIGEAAFAGNTNLVRVTIPDSVANVGEYAFGFCTELAMVSLPASLAGSISDSVFHGCPEGLRIVYRSASAGARSINVNFTDGNALDGVNCAEELVGAEGYAVPCSVWDNVVGTNSVNLVRIYKGSSGDFAGAADVSLEIAGSRGYWNCHDLASSNSLLYAYVDDIVGSACPTLAVSNIPFENCRVVIYASTDSPNAKFGHYTINGLNVTGNGSAYGTESWGDAGPWYSAQPLAQGVNYVVSPVIALGKGGELSIATHNARGATIVDNTRGTIAAIQIVETDDAPMSRTVTFDLGEHGSRIGGGELVQTVVEGAAAIAPQVAVTNGFTLIGWEADFSCVTNDLTVTARYAVNKYYGSRDSDENPFNPVLAITGGFAGLSGGWNLLNGEFWLNMNGSGVSADGKTLAIGDAGLELGFTRPFTNITVVVECEHIAASDGMRGLFSVETTEYKNRVGVSVDTDGTISGYYNTVDDNETSVTPYSEGLTYGMKLPLDGNKTYLAFHYDRRRANSRGNGVSVYCISQGVSTRCYYGFKLKYAIDDVVGVCVGGAYGSVYAPMTGMTICSLAVFEGDISGGALNLGDGAVVVMPDYSAPSAN